MVGQRAQLIALLSLAAGSGLKEEVPWPPTFPMNMFHEKSKINCITKQSY